MIVLISIIGTLNKKYVTWKIQSMKQWNLSLKEITVQKGAQLTYDLLTLNIACINFV